MLCLVCRCGECVHRLRQLAPAALSAGSSSLPPSAAAGLGLRRHRPHPPTLAVQPCKAPHCSPRSTTRLHRQVTALSVTQTTTVVTLTYYLNLSGYMIHPSLLIFLCPPEHILFYVNYQKQKSRDNK